jgi:hypothetical protein
MRPSRSTTVQIGRHLQERHRSDRAKLCHAWRIRQQVSMICIYPSTPVRHVKTSWVHEEVDSLLRAWSFSDDHDTQKHFGVFIDRPAPTRLHRPAVHWHDVYTASSRTNLYCTEHNIDQKLLKCISRLSSPFHQLGLLVQVASAGSLIWYQSPWSRVQILAFTIYSKVPAASCHARPLAASLAHYTR